MKSLLALIVALTLTGCAAQLVSSSPRTVMIKASPVKMAEAQTMADAECHKHQRYARLTNPPRQGNFLFDCVE